MPQDDSGTAILIAHSAANLVNKVFEFMDECAATVKADGEAVAKAYVIF